MSEEQTQLLDVPNEPEGDSQLALAGLTTAQLMMQFPDLAPPRFVPEECRKMSASNRYNGQAYKRDYPEAYAWVVKCRAAGMGYREITRMGGPVYRCIKAIELNEGMALASERRHHANMNTTLAEMYAEREMERLADPKAAEKISMGQLQLGKAIAIDKMLALSGEATARIEVTHKIDIHSEIKNARDEIVRAFEEMKRAKVIEVQPEALPAT